MPGLDVGADRIYCAEQIVIPQDLGDILKAYSKAVIRQAPEDLLSFSRDYFANLANLPLVKSAQLTPQMLADLREHLERIADPARLGPSGYGLVRVASIQQTCATLKIPQEMVDKVVSLGEFAEEVDLSEFIVLMFTIMSQDIQQVIEFIFDVFQDGMGTMPTQRFLALFSHIAARDTNIGLDFVGALAQQIATESVTFTSLLQIPEFQRIVR
eukprot:tig00020675_g12667.t1